MLFSNEIKQAIDIHNLYGSQENWAELGVEGIWSWKVKYYMNPLI